MNLQEVKRAWDSLGREDPLWAILTDPAKKGGRWDIGEFLQSGEQEIARALGVLERGRWMPAQDVAVDFGCGVGRLTQALARRFGTVFGIDIAPSMIGQARELNRYGERCRYVLNEADSLPLESASVDFVYSTIVLQHVAPRFSRRYIGEFLRILRPGGVAMFQVPDRRVRNNVGTLVEARLPGVFNGAFRVLSKMGLLGAAQRDSRIEMYGVPQDDVTRVVEAGKGSVVRCAPSKGSGPEWSAYEYVTVKN